MKRYLTRFKILAFLIIGLIVVGCSREDKDRKAISHCSDIKFISYANNNPHLFIDPSKAITETKKRDKKIKEWIKINHDPKDLMSIGKLRAKMNNKVDEISYPLHLETIFIFSKALNVTMLNDKIIDWAIDYKREELKNYEIFYQECVDEYMVEYAKMNEGEDFIKKYYEWQKQDVSNLNKYHHKVFDDIETFSKDYPFTTVMWELQKKLMKAVPR
tara:strand:+ start:191 stop:838 length:648 start_codon:yes stop_codon:yes gene_type:complete